MQNLLSCRHLGFPGRLGAALDASDGAGLERLVERATGGKGNPAGSPGEDCLLLVAGARFPGKTPV